MEKTCTKCKEVKSLDLYSPQSAKKDGKKSWCKSCCSGLYRAYAKSKAGRTVIDSWNAANLDKKRNHFKTFYEKNKDQQRLRVAEYAKANPEKVKLSRAVSKAKNIKSVYARNNARTNLMRQATPAWADVKAITSFYKTAELMRQQGQKVCVDHIVPLVSKRVCGLHVQHNLQVLSVSENSKKSNRFWPDMA